MRNNTKQARLERQQYQFTSLTEKGWKREDYKDLVIFTKQDDKYHLKVWKGTQADPFINVYSRSQEPISQYIDNSKKSADWREKDKQGGTRRTTPAAQAAKAIREELKQAFPGIKFSVTSENFSMGDAVRVSWTDGPTDNQVTDITCKYRYGHFNGMEDIYEYSNSRDDIPQTKYITTRREMSEAVKKVRDQYVNDNGRASTSSYTAEQEFYQIYSKCPLPAQAEVTGYESTGKNGLIEDFYTLTFNAPDPAPVKAVTPKKEYQESPKVEDIQIIEYSDRAVAVIGNTYPIKDQLKSIGARFNKFLRIDGQTTAGWILPASKADALQNVMA